MSTKNEKSIPELVVDVLGSYGLACVLLALLFILTFLGTIEQTEHGLYEVQRKYFESVFLVHETSFGGFLPFHLPLPLPGVYLVLILLAVNLLVGGILRMRKNRSTLGVLVIHLGIALMLAAGFVKLKLSNDGNLLLFEGQQSDEYQSYYEWEVAIWDAAQTHDVQEWLIPEGEFGALEGDGKCSFESPDLPIKVTLSRFSKNCNAVQKGPMFTSPNPVIDGYTLLPQQLQKEAEHNVAGCYVRTDDKSGLGKDAILWGLAPYPLTVQAGGKTWAIDLRKKHYRMPFTIVLDKFTHEMHPRTGMAKLFLSDVTKVENGVSQKVKIQMNEPLRADGLVLFQASWGPENAKPGEKLFSVFAVVHNPSDQWPLISCIVIGVGMLLAFGQKLGKYMVAQSLEQARAAELGAAGQTTEKAA